MSSEAIRPSTIDGIKRLAKSLKIEQSIQHAQALDAAAQAAGFQNFRHAGNVLRAAPKMERSHPGHRVFLTSYWKDRDGGATGRETLSIWLSVLWSDLITPLQLQNHRALADFRAEGPDQLAREHLQSSQSAARRAVCAAARALQFMDATKLRPSKSHSRAFPGGRSSNAVPGRDHYSIWYDWRYYVYVRMPVHLLRMPFCLRMTAGSLGRYQVSKGVLISQHQPGFLRLAFTTLDWHAWEVASHSRRARHPLTTEQLSRSPQPRS